MVEPLSIAVLTGVALTDGIKFLYGQADAILKRRAENRQAATRGEETRAELVPVQTPNVIEGQLQPIRIDPNAAEELADVLKDLRRQLEDYAQGYETPPDGNLDVLRATQDLRDAIEDVIGQRITFRGENRDSTGTPVVTGQLTIQEIQGRAVAVHVEDVRSGIVHGELKADKVSDGGEANAVRITKLGH
ncbi:hypothetical protein JHN63_22225 [Streptomyces sp. MBT65]|uniref:hypothetical protein n=1 Tax=Streptomyces sp. MBT65 TaxID=1488395 RepID=UPI00190E389C|nr:hypothetical protein [Streptomyces sp. MBT65]MBK3576475.1 hypothetical protein [Streptomyces sp. MBT65]